MNFQGIIIGPPRAGKTTLASTIISEHLARGVKVFAHDPNWQYKQCARYDSAAAWRSAAASAAKRNEPIARGSSLGGAASEVTALVDDLGKRYNRAGAIRVPMLAVFDEGSLLESSGSSHLGSADGQLMSNRAHRGVGLLLPASTSDAAAPRVRRAIH